MKREMTEDELNALAECIDIGIRARRVWYFDEAGHLDYDDEWPEVARNEAQTWRRCANALENLGLNPEEGFGFANRLVISAVQYESAHRK